MGLFGLDALGAVAAEVGARHLAHGAADAVAGHVLGGAPAPAGEAFAAATAAQAERGVSLAGSTLVFLVEQVATRLRLVLVIGGAVVAVLWLLRRRERHDRERREEELRRWFKQVVADAKRRNDPLLAFAGRA